jgi:hypothetical protein
MASTTDMNIIMTQGAAIKEVQSAKKQNLNVNQQFVAQQPLKERKEAASKIQKTEDTVIVEKRNEREEKEKKRRRREREAVEKEAEDKEDQTQARQVIDIRV